MCFIFPKQGLSSAPVCLSSSRVFLRDGFPTPQGSFPALQLFQAGAFQRSSVPFQLFQGVAFQRARVSFQRSSFPKGWLSSAPGCLSSALVFPRDGYRAPQGAFPALQFFQGMALQRPRVSFQRFSFPKRSLSMLSQIKRRHDSKCRQAAQFFERPFRSARLGLLLFALVECGLFVMHRANPSYTAAGLHLTAIFAAPRTSHRLQL